MQKKLKNFKHNSQNHLIIIKVYNHNKVKFIKQFWIVKKDQVKEVIYFMINNNINNKVQKIIQNKLSKNQKNFKKNNQQNNQENQLINQENQLNNNNLENQL